MLEDLGLEVICVDCPLKGLEKIDEDERIAMSSPTSRCHDNGFELAERAREKRPDLPVLTDV